MSKYFGDSHALAAKVLCSVFASVYGYISNSFPPGSERLHRSTNSVFKLRTVASRPDRTSVPARDCVVNTRVAALSTFFITLSLVRTKWPLSASCSPPFRFSSPTLGKDLHSFRLFFILCYSSTTEVGRKNFEKSARPLSGRVPG